MSMTEFEREIFNKGLRAEVLELHERAKMLMVMIGVGGTPATEAATAAESGIPVHFKPPRRSNGKHNPTELMSRASAILAKGGDNPINVKEMREALEAEGLQFESNRQLGQAFAQLGRGGFVKKKAKGYVFKKLFTPETPAQEGIVMP